MDSKAEYSALSSTRRQKKKLKQAINIMRVILSVLQQNPNIYASQRMGIGHFCKNLRSTFNSTL